MLLLITGSNLKEMNWRISSLVFFRTVFIWVTLGVFDVFVVPLLVKWPSICMTKQMAYGAYCTLQQIFCSIISELHLSYNLYIQSIDFAWKCVQLNPGFAYSQLTHIAHKHWNVFHFLQQTLYCLHELVFNFTMSKTYLTLRINNTVL